MTRTAAIFLLSAFAANAAPPPGTNPDSPMSHYMTGLTDVDNVSCCGPATDCRFTRLIPSDTASSGMAAWIDKETYGPSAPDNWVDVPQPLLDPKNDKVPDTLPRNTIACWHATNYTGSNGVLTSYGHLTCVRPRTGS